MTKDSALNRALWVLGYQVAAIVLGFLVDQDVVKAIVNNYPAIGVVLVAAAPVLSFARNYLRSEVPNL